MTKDHFAHVSEHFNLDQYFYANRPDAWRPTREGAAISSTLYVEQDEDHGVGIRGRDARGEVCGIYVCLPNMQLAEEVLQYIKDTEIMFL